MLKKFLPFILVSLFIIISIVPSLAATEEDIPPTYLKHFSQLGGDGFSGCELYGSKEKNAECNPNLKTMLKQGCAVTSITMLHWYYGMRWMPGLAYYPDLSTKLNPGRLDDWYVDHGVYDVHTVYADLQILLTLETATPRFYYYSYAIPTLYNSVVPNYKCEPYSTGANFECTRVNWSEPTTSDPNPKAKTLLDHDLKKYTPDIMKIKWRENENRPWNDSHFVVAAGYEKASSSYLHYNPADAIVDWRPRNFKGRYGEGNYEMLRINRFVGKYSSRPPRLDMLNFYIYSPVEIQIIDSKGRKTGYDPDIGTRLQENPMSLYYEEAPTSSIYGDDQPAESVKTLTVIEPLEGKYILRLFGTGDGPYTVKMKGVKEDGTVNLDTAITGSASVDLRETYRLTYSPTGDATLSQTNQPPVANAGSNQTGEQSYEITLDGSASSDPDGDPLKYSWSVASKPSGSYASFSDAKIVNPTFTPDMAGLYVLQLVVNDHFTDSSPAYVTITATPVQSRISVTPNYSKPLSAGSTTLSFDVNNIGRIGVFNGTLNINLADPDGTTVYTGTQTFSITVGQTKTVDVPVILPSLKFGNYTLTYTQSDETHTGSPTSVTLANSAIASFSFDKSSYRVRDTANLTLTLMNTGKFSIDAVTVAVTVPDAGYTDTRSVSIPSPSPSPQGGEGVLVYAIPIPDTILAGNHDVSVTLSLASGSSVSQSAKFGIQESSLVLGYSGTGTIAAGDIVNITIENAGSVDTTYSTDKLLMTDNKGNIVYQGNASGSILAGEKKTLADIQTPSTTSSGIVYLNITLRDTKTSKLSYLTKTLMVNGLNTSLFARTDKDVYLTTEPVTAISTLATGDLAGIENGTLNIKVNRYKQLSGGVFTQFIPKTGTSCSSNNGQFCYPYGVAIGSDGSIYVTDGSIYVANIWNYRVQKFDSNGTFIKKWGSYGSGDGQFNRPWGIAIASDGSVYVADAFNSRIQKFDATGNFITKWGSSGNGNGQFNHPYGIAVASDGSVYVVDSWNYRVQKFDSNGNFTAKWGSYGYGDGQFLWAVGIAVDSKGSVYVTDGYKHNIQKFDSNGNFITKWGGYGSGDGQFSSPYDIAVSTDGSVYVADTWNYRIQKFDSYGNFIAKWGSYGSNDGQFNAPSGIAISSGGTVYVVDSNNSRIQKMTPFASGSETLFETNISIAQPAGTSLDYTTAIGTLNATGMLYLEADLKNSLGQTIATSEYPFSITIGNTALIFNTDKRVYKSGENITVTGRAENKSTTDATNLSLAITSQKAEQGASKQTVYTKTVSIPANGSYPFTFTTSTSAIGTFALNGTITQNSVALAEATGQYEIASPTVSVSVSAPTTVDRNPFDVNVEIKNTGKIDINGQLYVGSGGSNIDYQLITIPAGETKLFQYTRQITQTTTYTVAVSGDASASASKTVAYGEAARISMGSGGIGQVYAEGMMRIPVTITNTGQVDEQLEVTFQLSSESGVKSQETKTYYLPYGVSVTDTLYYNLTAGSYQVSATSSQPSASATASFIAANSDSATMSNSVGSQGADGKIPATVNLTNTGYNTINGTIHLAIVNNQGKNVWQGDANVSGLASQKSGSYAISVDSTGIVSGAYNASIVLYSTSGQQLASNQTQVRISGPIFEITSVPVYAAFTVGHEAALAFTIKNTGVVEGAMNLSLKAVDVSLNQSVAGSLMPGEEKSYAFSFTVPEDAEEKEYLADYALTSVSSQGTSGQVKFHVAAVNVDATASLDKDAYRNGDTAGLTLNISKQTQFEDGEYLAIIRYGAHHDMKSFTLSSQPATLTFNVPLAEVTGENIFYSVHFTSGKTIAQKTISVNPYQPDLTIQNPTSTDVGVAAYKLEAVVTNQGKTASAASSVTLYDGDPQAGGAAIAALHIPAMNPGENTTVTYNWNILGKAGEHTIYGVADPNNIVAEWSEANNTASTAVSIPDLALSLATQQPSYSANQDAGILFDIANLTSGTTYQGLKLDTAIISGSGSAVANIIKDAPTLTPATESSYALNWNTESTAPGDYTISGKLTDEAGALAQGNAPFAILRTLSLNGNLSLSKDTVIQGFDLSINYTLTNNGNIDLSGGEVKAEIVPANSQQASASYTQAFGPMAVLAAISKTIAIDKVTVEPGDYTVRLTAITEGVSFAIGEKSLKVLPPLEAAKGLSLAPRVLVLSDKANDAQQNPAEAVIKDVLDRLGVYYKIARDMTEFKGEVRSGIYNAYLLTGKNPVIDGLDKELRERINAGETVILVNYEMMEDAKFREFTGVKNIGSLSANERSVTLYESPISHAGTMTVNGKVQKLEIASSSAVTAGAVFEQNKAYPVIVVNGYGKGKVITFAMDAGESAKYSGSITYSLLLNNAVNYSAPIEAVMLPSYPAVVEIGITSLGADFDLKVKEKLSTNGILLTYPVAVTGEDSIAWEFKLNEKSYKKLLYLTKIDILGGAYTNTTTVEYLKNNAYELYNTYPIEITAQSLTDLEMSILSRLEGMNGAEAITEKYRSIINVPLITKQDIQKVIQDLVGITDSLSVLGGDANAIRLDMDSLIRIFERRWMEATEAL